MHGRQERQAPCPVGDWDQHLNRRLGQAPRTGGITARQVACLCSRRTLRLVPTTHLPRITFPVGATEAAARQAYVQGVHSAKMRDHDWTALYLGSETACLTDIPARDKILSLEFGIGRYSVADTLFTLDVAKARDCLASFATEACTSSTVNLACTQALIPKTPAAQGEKCFGGRHSLVKNLPPTQRAQWNRGVLVDLQAGNPLPNPSVCEPVRSSPPATGPQLSCSEPHP